MKVLGIEVSFSLNQGADYQRQDLQRISRLTNLKELLLDRGRHIEKGLDLRLENGLDQLATLKPRETRASSSHGTVQRARCGGMDFTHSLHGMAAVEIDLGS